MQCLCYQVVTIEDKIPICTTHYLALLAACFRRAMSMTDAEALHTLPATLLGTVGGNLGMWVGMSVMTILVPPDLGNQIQTLATARAFLDSMQPMPAMQEYH
eukprot:1582258-Rhodomonas_salina.1